MKQALLIITLLFLVAQLSLGQTTEEVFKTLTLEHAPELTPAAKDSLI
ncbi:hypothetical protein [Pontibacter mangrovi]|nr:hypothetical protein [Pontibacter mangrovi]